MTPDGSPEQSSVEGKFVGGKVMRVTDYHGFKYAVVRPAYIIPTTHLSAAEPHPLPEMAKEVHQPEGIQEVIHLLIPGILQLLYVRIQVPQNDRIFTWGAFKRFLEVR